MGNLGQELLNHPPENLIVEGGCFSPENYWQQKVIAAEIAFQVKIISCKNLLPSLVSLKYNNKKKL